MKQTDRDSSQMTINDIMYTLLIYVHKKTDVHINEMHVRFIHMRRTSVPETHVRASLQVIPSTSFCI